MDAWPDWSMQIWGWSPGLLSSGGTKSRLERGPTATALAVWGAWCIFISRLQNSCLSAIEAFVPVASDYLKLDKHSTLGTYAELKYWQVA